MDLSLTAVSSQDLLQLRPLYWFYKQFCITGLKVRKVIFNIVIGQLRIKVVNKNCLTLLLNHFSLSGPGVTPFTQHLVNLLPKITDHLKVTMFLLTLTLLLVTLIVTTFFLSSTFSARVERSPEKTSAVKHCRTKQVMSEKG